MEDYYPWKQWHVHEDELPMQPLPSTDYMGSLAVLLLIGVVGYIATYIPLLVVAMLVGW